MLASTVQFSSYGRSRVLVAAIPCMQESYGGSAVHSWRSPRLSATSSLVIRARRLSSLKFELTP